MTASRLVIVEGIMGSGKSSLSRLLAHHLKRCGRASKLHAESWTRPNATDVGREIMRALPSRRDIWRVLSARELASRARARWWGFVTAVGAGDEAHVFDGQLFNGDVTLLMLMDEPAEALRDHLLTVTLTAAPLRPVLIHLRPVDVEAALLRTATVRGRAWVRSQIDWKLASPYAKRRGLTGLQGLITLYRHYDSLMGELAAELPVDRLAVPFAPGTEREVEARVHDFLGIPAFRSPAVRLQRWLRARYDEAFSHI